MSYVAIWLQACLHWRCAYFQTLSWNETIFVVDWDILYKLCGSANKWSKGFVLSGKIWWQFFSCNEACSKYRTHSTTTPKYTLTQRLVRWGFVVHGGIDGFSRLVVFLKCAMNNRAETVMSTFIEGTRRYGIPSRVRSDHGPLEGKTLMLADSWSRLGGEIEVHI